MCERILFQLFNDCQHYFPHDVLAAENNCLTSQLSHNTYKSPQVKRKTENGRPKYAVQRTWYGTKIFHNTSADNTGIYEGKQALAIIKASNVMFAVGRRNPSLICWFFRSGGEDLPTFQSTAQAAGRFSNCRDSHNQK